MNFKDFPVSALMDITSRPEIVFTEGQGSWLTDHNGRRYLDFIQGWAVNALGHSPQVIVDALAAQAPRLITPSPAFYNQPSIQLANLLTAQSCFHRVFFANSGAEANEGAIKLARKWGRKFKDGAYEIITTVGSFHGRTIATMSASGKPGWDTMYAPQVPGFPKATLNDLGSVEALISDKTVGIMLEPVQGEGGVNCATPAFMRGLRALADRHKLLLICDEVQTGVGRLGTLWGYQHFGIEPDIMTLGKGIGGGVPLAALLAKAEVSVFEHGDQGGTYNGNPLMCAVGLAVLGAVAQPAFLAHVQAAGAHLSARLTALSAELGLGPERGIGLLRALDLKDEIGAKVVNIARDSLPGQPGWADCGLLLNSPRPALLRFMPALNVSLDEIDRMIDGLRIALRLARA
ncbi:MAG: acetylornithine transaminase [Burkholderiales bacterium]|nr:acetylornithine transaminase [Burkholderiales bacterium]